MPDESSELGASKPTFLMLNQQFEDCCWRCRKGLQLCGLAASLYFDSLSRSLMDDTIRYEAQRRRRCEMLGYT